MNVVYYYTSDEMQTSDSVLKLWKGLLETEQKLGAGSTISVPHSFSKRVELDLEAYALRNGRQVHIQYDNGRPVNIHLIAFLKT